MLTRTSCMRRGDDRKKPWPWSSLGGEAGHIADCCHPAREPFLPSRYLEYSYLTLSVRQSPGEHRQEGGEWHLC